MIDPKTLNDEELIIHARTWPSGHPYTSVLVEELADRLGAALDRIDQLDDGEPEEDGT